MPRPRRNAALLVLLAVLIPGGARAGVTLHYEGTARSEQDAAGAVEDAVAFARARGWTFERRSGGVVLRPHAWCEPVEMLFHGKSLARSYVKTQFAGPETHVAVVELFRAIRPRFERLSIHDEGEYWDTSDRDALVKRMQSDGIMMVRLEGREPGTKGPWVLPSGRIVDLVTVAGPGARDAPAMFAEAGAKPLAAPFVPPHPWAPKLPSLAATPPERWQRMEAKEERFSVSFPGAAERAIRDDAVWYTARSGGALYVVSVSRPVVGKDAAQILADIPEAFAAGYVGRILADERGTVSGVRVRKLAVMDRDMRLTIWILVLGDRSYVLSAVARGAVPAEGDLRTFFDSFRVLE